MKYFRSTCLLLVIVITFLSCQSDNKSGSDVSNETNNTESKSSLYGFLCTALPGDQDWYLIESRAPLLGGMGKLNFPITTSSDSAQMYFNQGLVLAYGFNHAEAARSFHTASQIDTSCAMCYWGFAYVLGPNYNAGMEPDNYERAYDAIQKATSLSANCTDKEKDMINAMASRYTSEPLDDRSDLDLLYSNNLKDLTTKYPEDADIAAMYAESLMDMHPWDLWDKEGNPKSWTPEILTALERVFEIDPVHPGGHHFYIHAVEASFEPERGYESARLFDEGLVPGSGHLIHMPAHIYIRTGDYHKGSLANLRAVEVDSAYTTQCHAQGAYPLAYYPHNYHFLSATATLSGNSKLALSAADITSGLAHKQLMKEPGWSTLQHFYVIPYYVQVKFAKWQQILNAPEEVVELTYPRAVRHYARGMAFAGLREYEKARYELKQLVEYSEKKEIKEITIWDINDAYTLLRIAAHVLEGEILAGELNFEKSIERFRKAVSIEDSLNYDEPPDWFFSVRHHFGEVLIDAGMPREAIRIYEEDLRNLPKNGWALHGLTVPLRQIGEEERYQQVHEQFIKAWEQGDVSLRYSKVY